MIAPRPHKQSMAELKLRRLTEHNQRLREDLARPRVRISEASTRWVVLDYARWTWGMMLTMVQLDQILHVDQGSHGELAVGPPVRVELNPSCPLSGARREKARTRMLRSSGGVVRVSCPFLVTSPADGQSCENDAHPRSLIYSLLTCISLGSLVVPCCSDTMHMSSCTTRMTQDHMHTSLSEKVRIVFWRPHSLIERHQSIISLTHHVQPIVLTSSLPESTDERSRHSKHVQPCPDRSSALLIAREYRHW